MPVRIIRKSNNEFIINNDNDTPILVGQPGTDEIIVPPYVSIDLNIESSLDIWDAVGDELEECKKELANNLENNL